LFSDPYKSHKYTEWSQCTLSVKPGGTYSPERVKHKDNL